MTSRQFSRKRIGQALGLVALGLTLLVGSAEYGSADYGRTGGSSPMMGIAKDQETAIFSVEKLQLDMAQASQPDIAMSPPVFEFGPVIVGETKAGRVRVLNVGQAELVINSATLAGFPGAIVGFAAPLKLAPGAEAELQIDFKPTVEGTLKGTLEIASNDPDEPKVSMTLRGAGVREITDLTVSTNTTWKGDIFARNITIAKGVTITAHEDLVVYATGDLQIDGNVDGSCRNVKIIAEQQAVINGAIKNLCSPEQEQAFQDRNLPGITLVAMSDLVLAGPLTAMGSLVLVSDQNLAPSTKGVLALSGAPARHRTATSIPKSASATPISFDAFQQPKKWDIKAPITGAPRKRPSQEQEGQVTLGQDGSVYIGTVGKNVAISADITAARGADADPIEKEGTAINGVKGGNGGSVTIQVLIGGGVNKVTLEIAGDVIIAAGDGGNGGDATAKGNPNAKAVASDGGQPGVITITITGNDSQIIFAGAVTLRMGNGGDGGYAEAMGRDGRDGCPPEKGGNAEAKGGNGGENRKRFEITRNIVGVDNVTIEGGNGGRGGNAIAMGGDGGTSTCCEEGKKHGAAGGKMTAKGGNGGGTAQEFKPEALKARVRMGAFWGGNGGDTDLRHGNGGNGAPCKCKKGGNGGDGGRKEEKPGEGGKGFDKRDGRKGLSNVLPNGKGGDGGDGDPGGEPGKGTPDGKPGKNLNSSCIPSRVVDLSFGIIPGWKDCEFFTLSVGQLADALTGGEFLAAAHQNLNSLAIIDLASRQLKMISVGSQPHSVEMTPDGRRAFVGNFGSGDISVVDIPNQRVIETVRVGNQTVALSFDQKTNKLYAVNFGDSNVSIVQYREGGSQVVGTVRGLREPIYVTLSPDGRRGYVSSQRRGQDIVVFDTASTNIVGRIPVPNMELRKLAVSPDGKRLYAAARTDAQGTGRIAVIDTANLQIVQQIPVEAFPLALTVTPSGACLIVTHSFVNKVSFIDLKTEKVLAVLPSGQTPQAVAIGGELAYVTNLESDAISVYNVGSCQ
jgi:YVTN family beta-propeller protein